MKRSLRFSLPLTVACCLGLLGVRQAVAAPIKLNIEIPDPDPELQRRSFQVPEGWEITLFASDPMIAKPIQMNFDPAGRLWVATSATYPQIKPGQPAEDKIVVLEDKDGDGKADASTVFADGLLIPTGVAPGDGGAYIANSTEVLHLKDTDGDGKADASRVLLSGFGTEDTHHLLHTFRWGPEGLLYFNQSVYIHSHVETPWGVRRLMAGGIWSLRPETMRLEVFARGWVNAWGHQFDRWGQSFVTDGAGGEGVNYVIPDASYITAAGSARIFHGLNPGQPKLCANEQLTGSHVPPGWLGSILTNDFRGHRIARFVRSDDGAGFASTRVADVVTTSHVAFRPVDLKMGPDGALYIADFYNPIINHGEIDFRDPRRDLTHGRIWRLSYKGRPLVERPKLVGAPVEQLLAALKAPEDYTRSQAKRVLKERGAGEVLPALAAWVKQLDAGDPQFEHHRLEALWTYQSLDVVEPDLLRAVLASKDFHARAAAVRVIYHWQQRVAGSPDARGLLAAAVADEHPRVRMEAVCALRQLGDGPAVELAMRALDKPLDKFLDYTLWQTAHDLEKVWLPEFAAGKLTFDGNAQHAVFSLKSSGDPAAVAPLVSLYQAGRIPAAEEAEVLAIVTAQGGPRELGVVFELALRSGKLSTAQRAVLLDLLGKAANQRNARPEGDLSQLLALFAAPAADVRAAALRLAGSWKLEAARPILTVIATTANTPEPMRQAAIEGVALLGDQAGVDLLVRLTAESQPVQVRLLAAAALARPNLKLAAERAVAVLASVPADADTAPLFDALIQRKDGPALLVAALAEKTLPAATAAVGVRRASGAGRDMQPLIDALNLAGKLGHTVEQLTPEQKTRLVADVPAHGNAERGEAVFRKANQQCLTCHAIAGGGGQVGPDLVSIGASAPLDYLLESMLEPSKKIKEGYHTTVVTTDSGQVFTGLLVRKTDDELLLRDATGKEIAIAGRDVESQTISPNSLMPIGQVNALRRDELIDLIRFLSELGKEGPYQVSKARLVRNWKVLDMPRLETARTFDAKGTALAIDDDPALPWQSAVSTVAGLLPLAELPSVNRWNQQLFSFARFSVEVPESGKIGLRLNDTAGLELWAGKTPLKVAADMLLELPPGVHTISMAIDQKQRKEPLRVELVNVGGGANVAPAGKSRQR